jgi:uncharacterized protein YbjT (DUF2867 family)
VRTHNRPLILVTGATGYIGGRLIPRLLEAGHQIRCLVRNPDRLKGRPWESGVEIVTGDVLDPESLELALAGVDDAYYLVHSLASGSDFHDRDMIAATNFGNAAKKMGCRRIIYLGGLAVASKELSHHLQSRQETGNCLRTCGVPITEFQAGVIVGSGSLSFEMIRYLTERVPIMICPKWIYTLTQPIAIRDVIEYLAQALEVDESIGRTIEIGGAAVVSYGGMMTGYSKVRGLRRWLVPIPVLTPRLSSYWVNLVTPIPGVIARPLIEGLRNENIVRDHIARELFPDIVPLSYEQAVDLALERLRVGNIDSAWSDALITSQGDIQPRELVVQEGMIIEKRQLAVSASCESVFKTLTGIGGNRGWFYMNWAWIARGQLDKLLGGVGLRRGRRDPDELRIGDALDFWRVEAVEKDRMLRLRAEMKVPGKAWLQYEVTPHGDGECVLSQVAYFASKGLAGWLYWYVLYPFHALIFSGMIKEIARRSVERSAAD